MKPKKKNVCTTYGRRLKKKKSVPSGSGHDAVLSPEFNNLDWLANHIKQRSSTVTNMQSRNESEDDVDDEDAESPNILGFAVECNNRSSEDKNHLQSQMPISSPIDSCVHANDGQPQTSSQQKGKAMGKSTKSTTKRPWASKNSKKTKDKGR